MADESDKLLRQEIIESQKTQADFLKWKLISIAAVASIAFGFTAPTITRGESAKLLICLVPLLCGYIDLISLHLMIRIITIGLYLKAGGNDYEKYVYMVRHRYGTNPFVFEAVALHGSSLVFNIVIFVLGFVLPADAWPVSAYRVAGILGVVATLFLWAVYVIRARQVSRLAEQFGNQQNRPY